MRRAVGWLVTLVVLLALAVVADRIAVRVAERAAVDAFEQGADDVAGATLDIGGFPFLTQVARGGLAHVTASADTASFGGFAVTDLTVEARGVGIAPPYQVETGTASALLAVADLEEALREQTRLSGELTTEGDTLVLSGSVLGLPMSVAGSLRVADADTLAIDVVSVDTGSGPLPVDDLRPAAAALLTGIEVSLSLPEGVALESLEVADNAVRLTVTGTDVALEDLVAS